MRQSQRKNLSPFLFILLFGLILHSCKWGSNKPDISDIKLEVEIQRFDKDLFALKQNADLNVFKDDYKEILDLYSNKVIGLGDINAPNYMDYLNKFLYDSTMVQVYDTVVKVFPNMEEQEKDLSLAFKYLKYYFPEYRVPVFYTQLSGFNQSIVVAQDLVGISLDKYLGEDCEFYTLLRTPQYAKKNMIPNRIAQDVILAYGLTEFPFKPLKDDLISNMIYQGKIRYFMQKIMPDLPEYDIMKYSKEQQNWCEINEEQMWGHIIEQKHLFNSQYRTIIKYINDGPNTSGMPAESPSRTGIWLGLQIVKEFMKNNPEYKLEKLMKENDYAMILRKSGFQP
jgi:hypothetical protein